jgi:hypothetical protein
LGWQGDKIMLILGPQKVTKIGGAVIELNNLGHRQFLTFESFILDIRSNTR